MITLESVKPSSTPLQFDVMIGERFYKTISMKLTVGTEYHIDELKEFAKMKLPSLAHKQFTLLPCV